MINPFKRKVQKTIAGMDTALSTNLPGANSDKDRRGLAVYTLSQLMGITGKDKEGRRQSVTYEQAVFYLSIDERNAIVRLCTPVAGIISSRMNRISGLKWKVVSKREQEDLDYERLKAYYALFTEYAKTTELKFAMARITAVKKIQAELPDVLPDLSNFRQSLLRWRKRLQMKENDSAKSIEEWINQPNINDNMETFIKKYVYDLMTHGNSAIYKESRNGVLENIYMLPGGTTFPIKNKFVSGVDGFVQVSQGMEPLIYFADEISLSQYLPTTSRAYGNIPLEALINKISETLLFDKLMADQADGTIPPNKMLVVGENNPFGSLSEGVVPVDAEEAKRIQAKVNQPEKGGVVVFSGNSATILDMTRENTMTVQMQRQKDIREEVGLVFNASNMEMNLTGSSNTSGRETSETQQEISEGRGIVPICNMIESKFNREIIPFKFGNGWSFQFEKGNETDELTRIKMMMETGVYAVNEIRQDELGLDPFTDTKYDEPQPPQPEQGGEGGSPFEGM